MTIATRFETMLSEDLLPFLDSPELEAIIPLPFRHVERFAGARMSGVSGSNLLFVTPSGESVAFARSFFLNPEAWKSSYVKYLREFMVDSRAARFAEPELPKVSDLDSLIAQLSLLRVEHGNLPVVVDGYEGHVVPLKEPSVITVLPGESGALSLAEPGVAGEHVVHLRKRFWNE